MVVRRALIPILFAAVPVSADISFGTSVAPPLPAAHAPTQVLLADVDGDGRLDAFVPGRGVDGNVLLARGTAGASWFAPWQATRLGANSDWAESSPSASSTDIFVAIRATDGGVARFTVQHGSGSLVESGRIRMEREPRSLLLADLDGDGSRELACANYASAVLRVERNQPGGAWTAWQRRRIDDWYGGNGSLQQVIPGDVDLDGDLDVVGTALSSGSIAIWYTRRSEPAAWPVQVLIQPVDGEEPAVSFVALADLDADGDEDIVAQGLSTSWPQPILIFWNDQGSFLRQQAFAGPESGYGWSIAAGDLDRDGDLDLVTTTAINGGIYLLENLGTPRAPLFGAAERIRAGTFYRHVSLADVDGDCDLDLAAVDISSSVMICLPNLGGCGVQPGPGHGAPPAHQPSDGGPSLDAQHSFGTLDARGIARALAAWGGPATGTGAGGSLAAGSCGPADGTAGRCDEPHATPGCYTTACCEAVCLVVPDCCVIAWDQACVDVADTECDGLYCPAPGSCAEAHDTGGCADEACCARTVRFDGWCGSAVWDQTCVDDAAWWCPFTPCELEGPPGARPEGEPCYDRINDGCTLIEPAFDALACGERVAGTCTTGAPRDTDWFALPAGGHTIGLRAEFPASLTIVRGSCTTALEQVGWHVVGPCDPLLTSVCVPAGESWFAIVSLGSPEGTIQSGQPCTDQDPDNPPGPDDPPIVPGAFGTRYEVSLSCGTCVPSPDLNGDGVVDGADLGLLLSVWGTTGQGIVGDLTGDGTVDGADLGAMISAWG